MNNGLKFLANNLKKVPLIGNNDAVQEQQTLFGVFVEPTDKDIHNMLTKAKRFWMYQSAMALVTILLQYIEYNEFYEYTRIKKINEGGEIVNILVKEIDEPTKCVLLRMLVMASNVISVIIAYKRMQADLLYKKMKRNVPFRERLFSDPRRARWCLMEFVYLLIFIPPHANKNFMIQERHTDIILTLDMFFTFVILTRAVYCIKTYNYVNSWNSWKTMQICRKYMVYQDEKFAGKAQLKGNAYTSIGVLIFMIMGKKKEV